MLSKQQGEGRYQVSVVSLDELVPRDHLVRKIEKAIDFSFIYDLVKDRYSPDNGRPSIDPVVLIKMVFIQYLFGIRSMRQTIKEIETNVAYRWFLGYDFTQPIPHFTTFGKNYVRRFQGTDLFEQIFTRILEEACRHGFVDPSALYIDSTHVKAHANKRKYSKQRVQEEQKKYQQQLHDELNQDRIEHGKKPLPKKSDTKWKEVKQSTTDPDSGWFVKNEKEQTFAYSFHAASDEHGFVVSAVVTAANIHDSQVFTNVFEQAIENVGKPNAVAVDAGYKTPYISKYLLDEGVRPVMPYTRSHTKKGFFRKHDYVYDEYFDCSICPAGQVLSYETTTREGYRMYRSDSEICSHCPLRFQCTESREAVKRISRHIWADYLEEVEHLRHTEVNKRLYTRRKETIERVFANLKEKHGLRWTTLRGLKKVTMQAMLAFAAMNLKKLANWLWNKGNGGRFALTGTLVFCIFHDKPPLLLWQRGGLSAI
ncbi:IS1182 family transposase [Brevibacillus humidisoli]|uniref:IS1182 family transposase n=1 Tax=Brevibacillus humidisoli TaxID=2895522 RepID=UPI001E3B0723|nr:IS1182 family transposase [Brevibacillus humidisoli]UFJ41908.1 IS1182 family transposase [Brevibacillus humidisoli]